MTLISWRPSADGTGIKAAMSHSDQHGHRHASLLPQAPAFLSKTSCTTWSVWRTSAGLQKCSFVQPCLNIRFRKRCCNISKGNPMCRSDISQSEPLPDLSELTLGVRNLSQTRCNKSHNRAPRTAALTPHPLQTTPGRSARGQSFSSATIGSTDPPW